MGDKGESKKAKIRPRHKTVLKRISGNGGSSVTEKEALLQAGYSESYANSPDKIKKTKSWETLLQQSLPDELLTKTHRELLLSSKVEHLTFPAFNEEKRKNVEKGEQITDEEITELLASVNCTVRKIVHGENARHVYFWASDNLARDRALDKGYKLKGKYEPDKHTVEFDGFSKEELIDLITRGIGTKS